MTASLIVALTQLPVIAAKTLTFNEDGDQFSLTTGGGQAEWLNDAVSIVPLCVALVLCCWMYFRFQRKKISLNKEALNEAVEKHLSTIDDRISNLETIILDREKEERFREL